MGVLASVLTVLFVILCVFLIIIILLQTDKGSGMGLLGGSSQSAFGSSTADVITKITAFMVGLFLVGSLGLAVLESTQTNIGQDIVDTDVKPSGEIQPKKDTKANEKKDSNK